MAMAWLGSPRLLICSLLFMYPFCFLLLLLLLLRCAAASVQVVSFLVQFLEDIDKELSALKLSVNTRGRAVAAEFLKSFK